MFFVQLQKPEHAADAKKTDEPQPDNAAVAEEGEEEGKEGDDPGNVEPEGDREPKSKQPQKVRVAEVSSILVIFTFAPTQTDSGICSLGLGSTHNRRRESFVERGTATHARPQG